MEFNEKDSQTMLEVQKELAVVLRRANNQQVEAALAAFALVRLARELLEKYPAGTSFMLTDLCCAFLRRDEVEQQPSPLAIN